MRGWFLTSWAIAAFLVGCGEVEAPRPKKLATSVDPLPVQQLNAYPEVSTGRFVSLADFEDSFSGPPGHRQVQDFAIEPSGSEGDCKFVVNVTRTGAGAIRVVLAPKAELAFNIPHVHNFSNYTLLSLAINIQSYRDDLRVTLSTDSASWSYHRALVVPGWNTVLVDIRRLRQVSGFDTTAVRKVAVSFADAASPVTFYLDDVMLDQPLRV